MATKNLENDVWFSFLFISVVISVVALPAFLGVFTGCSPQVTQVTQTSTEPEPKPPAPLPKSEEEDMGQKVRMSLDPTEAPALTEYQPQYWGHLGQTLEGHVNGMSYVAEDCLIHDFKSETQRLRTIFCIAVFTDETGDQHHCPFTFYGNLDSDHWWISTVQVGTRPIDEICFDVLPPSDQPQALERNSQGETI